MVLFIDDYRLKIRAFKWNSTLLIRDGFSSVRAEVVFLFRSTITTNSELIAVPYPGKRLSNVRPKVILLEIMKRLPVLGSCDNLEWLAQKLCIESFCKFRPPFTYYKGTYMFVFDLKIKQDEQNVGNVMNFNVEKGGYSVLDAEKGNYDMVSFWEKVHVLLSRICKGIDDEENTEKSKICKGIVDGENVEKSSICKCKDEDMLELEKKVEWFSSMFKGRDQDMSELEEKTEKYLKEMCPGLIIAEPKGMEEVMGVIDIDVLVQSEEPELECPICRESIDVGDRFATTFCLHIFHRDCMIGWLATKNKSCPMCRSEFRVYT